MPLMTEGWKRHEPLIALTGRSLLPLAKSRGILNGLFLRCSGTWGSVEDLVAASAGGSHTPHLVSGTSWSSCSTFVHQRRGRLTGPRSEASQTKLWHCKASSKCSRLSLVMTTFSMRKVKAMPDSLQWLRRGSRCMLTKSKNLRPSGPERPAAPAPLMREKSGQGGPAVASTRAGLVLPAAFASATPLETCVAIASKASS